MANNGLYPLLFEPVLKDYIWGGRNLEKLRRVLPPEGVIAESWEITGHEDGTTRVANGRFSNTLLTDLHQELGLDLIGRRCAWAQARGKYPLLIKLLDASRPLSVQVHPQVDYALAHEGNGLGKTEMWVVLHATPDAEVILGLAHLMDPQDFRVAIRRNTLEPHLHRIPVQAGDHICVPAGSMHAIMGGLLIAEIQQNSNTTYRVYELGPPRHAGTSAAHREINRGFQATSGGQPDPRAAFARARAYPRSSLGSTFLSSASARLPVASA